MVRHTCAATATAVGPRTQSRDDESPFGLGRSVMSSAFGHGFANPHVRRAALLGTALVCAGLAWGAASAALSLSLAGLIAVVLMAVGIRRQWARGSVIDPFAPYCFPLLYVGFSSLYPAWLILHDNNPLM